MKVSRKICVAVAAVAVLALAVWALAGFFFTTGCVLPVTGYADSTLFTWYVTYAKAPGQSAPTVFLHVYKDGNLYGGDRMMAIDEEWEILVNYKYEHTLPAGSYTFEMWTIDAQTGGNGPVVS